jgi:hypothetical protein
MAVETATTEIAEVHRAAQHDKSARKAMRSAQDPKAPSQSTVADLLDQSKAARRET